MEKYNRIITIHLTSAHEIEIFKIKHRIFLVFRNLSAVQNDFLGGNTFCLKVIPKMYFLP